jgi:hypothetical protein
MPTARVKHNCALVKTKILEVNEIVAVGGSNTGGELNTVEIYNMETYSWRTAGATIVRYKQLCTRTE